MSLRKWLLLLAFAFCGYFIAYQFISKPLTDGEIERLIERKVNLLEKAEPHQLIILAGSNGRFSHSCETITRDIGVKCVNASLMAGVGIDYILQRLSPLMKMGDVVYMPYEYEQYNQEKNEVYAGPDNSILWKSDKSLLWNLGPDRFFRSSLYADEKFFIHGIVETALSKKGIKRRFDEASINSVGDQTGHTPELGSAYKEFLASKVVKIPLITPASNPKFSAKVLASFLQNAKDRGITVIGGLPSTFSDVKIPSETIVELSTFYKNNGQKFLVLDNLSQYPRSCFFDMPYHLSTDCQEKHSHFLAKGLASMNIFSKPLQ